MTVNATTKIEAPILTGAFKLAGVPSVPFDIEMADAESIDMIANRLAARELFSGNRDFR